MAWTSDFAASLVPLFLVEQQAQGGGGDPADSPTLRERIDLDLLALEILALEVA